MSSRAVLKLLGQWPPRVQNIQICADASMTVAVRLLQSRRLLCLHTDHHAGLKMQCYLPLALQIDIYMSVVIRVLIVDQELMAEARVSIEHIQDRDI